MDLAREIVLAVLKALKLDLLLDFWSVLVSDFVEMVPHSVHSGTSYMSEDISPV